MRIVEISSGPYGLGYKIIEKVSDDGKASYKMIYHTPSREQAIQVKLLIEQGSTNIPDPSQDWPALIIKFEEKHFDRHFIVRTPLDMEKMALHVINQRTEANFYQYLTHNPVAPIPPDFTKESIQNLPVSFQPEAFKKWRSYESAVKSYEHMQVLRDLHARSLAGDAKAALKLLDVSEGEYERMEIIHPDKY